MQGGSHFFYNAISILKWESIEKPYHSQGAGHFSYIVVNFHPEVRIYWKTLPLAGGSHHFSYIAANFHPEVRIYWKTLPLAGGSHFSYIAANFHPEVRIYWKTLPLEGGSHFSYTEANFYSEVRIYWKTLPFARQQSLFLHCSNLPSTCQKKINLNQSFQLICTTCKKKIII